jgi:single-stranded DNA-specific DHH superfamily exonuclease
MALLESKIEKENLLDHKVILCLMEKDTIPANIAGLCANKIMAKYQRPVAVLTKKVEKLPPWESANEVDISYSGSARGCSIVGATDFRGVCNKFDGTIYAQGHAQAFGLSLDGTRINDYLTFTDNVYKDIADEAVYHVDSIIDFSEIITNEQQITSAIINIGSCDDLWGQDVTEPYIVIENITVTSSMVNIYEKRDDTLNIKLGNNISAIKFKISTDEKRIFQMIPEKGSITITIIGYCRVNNFNGNVSAQIEIKDFEVLTTKKYDF